MQIRNKIRIEKNNFDSYSFFVRLFLLFTLYKIQICLFFIDLYGEHYEKILFYYVRPFSDFYCGGAKSKSRKLAVFCPERRRIFGRSPVGIDFCNGDNEAVKDEATRSRRYKNVADGKYFYMFSDSLENPQFTNSVLDFARYFKAVGKPFRSADLTGEKISFQKVRIFITRF
jgi:hypothetical protein